MGKAKYFHVRMTDQEKEVLRRAAEKTGLTMTDLIKTLVLTGGQAILNHDPDSKETIDLWGDTGVVIKSHILKARLLGEIGKSEQVQDPELTMLAYEPRKLKE